ncbi:MAG: hypothetical protein Q7K54_02560 [Candidatus Parcubacteria bacterium]|nr:hypothetical protein [Candidatus Parcubacteria bacterium]
MKIVRPKNTKDKGTVEFLVYKEGKTFVGVCLTFDIVEEGNNPEKLMESIQEAAQGHLKVVRTQNMSDDLLNRHAPKEYWDIYYKVIGDIQSKKSIKSPYSFFIFPYATRTI